MLAVVHVKAVRSTLPKDLALVHAGKEMLDWRRPQPALDGTFHGHSSRHPSRFCPTAGRPTHDLACECL